MLYYFGQRGHWSKRKTMVILSGAAEPSVCVCVCVCGNKRAKCQTNTPVCWESDQQNDGPTPCPVPQGLQSTSLYRISCLVVQTG
uniref:Uncharacterized protein n=1 Tax=Anguilla anguilla TaxID=7936 RepID=A0A0E9WTE8_ANGAN